jgi:serine/threonine protein kinase
LRQIEELYHSARERDPAERTAFLLEACGSDEALLSEVESLLAQGVHGSPLDEHRAWDNAQSLLESIAAQLKPGSQLGPYKIEALIGAGGMGEVYKARDTRLNRDVAIKVSSEKFSSRFEREARAVAALNHPNICTLHDVGPNYLVMELVEGPTLADRCRKGALPLEEALPIARQIADALEAAHEKGIVHRDLKPANIKIKPDGAIKVLDFGLATQSADRTAEEATESMTAPGTVLGTAAYMSPEQARGKPVDKRTDIWAFGAVLYEMLAGQRAFLGETTTDVLAAVVNTEPKWNRAPEKAQRLLRKCLEKDPERRLRHIADFELLLEYAAPPGRPHSKLPWAAAVVLGGIAAAALWAPWRSEKPLDRPLVRLDVDLGADVWLPTPTLRGSSVAISPDGTRLAYASGTPTKLYTRRLDQQKATELPETQGAILPFFSPDGHWVGFIASNKLNKISVEGGAVVPLGDFAAGFAGASWGEDGSIFLSQSPRGLLRIPAGGGPPERVAGLGDGEVVLDRPQILPGGKAILFAAASSPEPDKVTIEVLTLADRHRKILARGGSSPRYLPTSNGAGHLVYVNKATLFAIPFDLDKLETRGMAVPVLGDVVYERTIGSDRFDFSRTGTWSTAAAAFPR